MAFPIRGGSGMRRRWFQFRIATLLLLTLLTGLGLVGYLQYTARVAAAEAAQLQYEYDSEAYQVMLVTAPQLLASADRLHTAELRVPRLGYTSVWQAHLERIAR